MSKLPAYYQATDSQNIYLPRYEEIAQAASSAKSQLPHRSSKAQTALFVIDAQIGFCQPQASLYVPGAEADMARTAGSGRFQEGDPTLDAAPRAVETPERILK